MERLWLRHYPPGVPADIDLSRYPSLVAMFEEELQAHIADRRVPASAWARSLTYRELDEASRRVCRLATKPRAEAWTPASPS